VASPDDTIVMYSTDNGAAEQLARCGKYPSRTRRTPMGKGLPVPRDVSLGRGTSEPGSLLTGISASRLALPTLLAAAGEPEHQAEVPEGHTVAVKTSR